MSGDPSRRVSRQLADGDIVVIKVAAHFHVCRALGNGERLDPIETRMDLDDALALAQQLAVGHRCVFLYGRASDRDCVEITCSEPH